MLNLKNAPTVTYRDAIQRMQSILDDVYDYSSYLRDHASGDEKDYWNQFRTKMQGINTPLSRLDNSLTAASAKDEVLGIIIENKY